MKEFTGGSFREVIDDVNANTKDVTRLVLCCGKIYYDLLETQLKKKVKDIKAERKELEEKFLKVEKEKEDMYRKFEIAIMQLRTRADYKNQILDEKLRVL